MAATKKKQPVKVALGKAAAIHVESNGTTAAHELAVLKLVEAEGYDLTEWQITDYENYDEPAVYVLERVDR